MKKQTSRRRIDVNVEELDRDHRRSAMREPLNEADGQTLKTALHAHGGKTGAAAQHGEDERRARGSGQSRARRRNSPPETNENKPAGHGRNGAERVSRR